MDHRPYEDWLLNDDLQQQIALTSEQQRDLRVHLRNCAECSALEHANFMLRSSKTLPPVDGFGLRFRQRLDEQRSIQQRRAFFGWFMLAIVSLGGLIWLLFPFLPYFAMTPSQLSGKLISNMVYITLMVRALNAILFTFLSVLGSLVPLYVWMLMFVLIGGLGLLWSFSFHKTGKIFQTSA